MIDYGYPRVTTQVLTSDDPDAISAAAAAIGRGDLVVLPTDTVYGVGANAFDEKAVLKLYIVKRRVKEKGIPILVAGIDAVELVAATVPPLAQVLMQRFWPGPLTLVLPKRENLPPAISDTYQIAVRLPDHDVCRRVIAAAGGVLATSSANLSGRPPALTAEAALNDLAGAAAVVIDAGPSGGQIASTVVDCSGQALRILRPGPLSMDELRRAVRES